VRVSVIIPTRNVAQAIGSTIGDLPADLVTEVIVVDSNSTDGTPEIAARLGCPSLDRTVPRLWPGLPGFRFFSLRLPRGAVHLTDPFYDIDVAADLSQLADELRRTPGKAPRTAKWLSDWASAGANKRFL
jgi:glycosyltransferase involved in cell wall biosynthesis